MTIPDPLVYASIPVVAAAVAWIGRQFVKDTQKETPTAMTISDFREIAELLKEELNGRDMFAKEARDKFAAIEAKIEEHTREMKAFIRSEIAGAHA